MDEQPLERIYNLDKVRSLRQITLDEIGRPGERSLWCEWNHKHEEVRSFRHMFVNGYHASYKWSKLINPGDTCIDIGAHSGDTTLPMGVFASNHGNRGVVVAVEPNPEVFEVLELNLALNQNHSDFRPIRVAVTREDVETVEISDYGTAMCNCGIIDAPYSDGTRENVSKYPHSIFTAKGLSLKTLCDQTLSAAELSKLSFVKIDCEGYDKEILRGAKEFLGLHKPILFVEWFVMFDQNDSDELFNVIDDLGYTAHHPLEWTPLTSLDKNPGDILLVPNGQLDRLAR